MKIRDRIKELKRVPAGDLLPNPKNWRTHPAAQADALRGVLGEVGFADAVLARETENGLMLIDGHLRAEVAPDASVPVLVLDVTQDEADKILATHDPLAAMATTDAGQLADLLEGMRFDSDAATAMTESLAKAEGVEQSAEVVEDDVPEPPADPVTQPGDLITLGDHRVLCGDATDAGHVDSVVNGSDPFLMVTDPPYGVDYDARRRCVVSRDSIRGTAVGEIENDDRADWTAAWELFKGGVAYVYHGDKHSATVHGSLADAGLLPRHFIIWAKHALVPSPYGINAAQVTELGLYHFQHEPCWYALRGDSARWIGGRSQSTLWQINKPQKSETGHSTQKPVECMARPIRNHDGDVYDPFLGSGTTLIAAEQLGRKCYGLEISPAYCDVIVNRWESLTGGKAERNGARTDSQTNEAENTGRRKERRPDKPKRTRSTKRQTAGT